MKRTAIRVLLTILMVGALSSCLSTEASIDFSGDRTQLSLVYTIPRSVWDLGVFDEGSPERAIPVSERDARETAGLYDDVDLVRYTLRRGDDAVTIETIYRVESDDSLAALWGTIGSGHLVIDRERGAITVPIGAGIGSVDGDQRQLIADTFRDQTFSLELRAPAAIQGEPPQRPSGTVIDNGSTSIFQWEVPMADLMLAEEPSEVRARWEVP